MARNLSNVAMGLAVTLCVALGTALAYAGGHCNACPDCGNKVCVPSVDKKKEKKHCWDVDCKDICIPKARWPWECCCEPQCARVKTIKVLKRVEYECEKCGTKWDVHSTGCSDCDCDCPRCTK